MNERASIRRYSGVIIDARVLILEVIFLNVEANVPDIEVKVLDIEADVPDTEAAVVLRKATRAGSGVRTVDTEAMRVIRRKDVTKSLA
jgi:hypothetical protein